MFDIGWQEVFLVAIIALIVIGPKELPRALKTVMGVVRKLKGMARDFQSGLDDIVRETELDEMRREIEAETSGDLRKRIEESIDPDGEVSKDLEDMRSIEGDLNKAAKSYGDDVKKPADDAKNDADTAKLEATPIEEPAEPVTKKD